jgi:hypothetical protein
MKENVMRNHTMLKKAVAAALLSAVLASPAAVLTAGAAAARPIESPNCTAMMDNFTGAMHAARVAKQQGDTKAYNEWMTMAGRAKANFNRHCLS